MRYDRLSEMKFDRVPVEALIIRSAAMWQFRDCIGKLRSEFPGIKLRVVAQSQSATEISGTGGIEEIIEIPNGPINIATIPFFKIISRVKMADLLVVLYNEAEGLEYFHVDSLAMILPARQKVIYDVNDKFRHFPDTEGGLLDAVTRATKKLWYALYDRDADKIMMPALVRAGMAVRSLSDRARLIKRKD